MSDRIRVLEIRYAPAEHGPWSKTEYRLVWGWFGDHREWCKPRDSLFRRGQYFTARVVEYVPLTRAEAAEQALAEARAEIDRLKAELSEAHASRDMACTEPRDDCTCDGCSYAREVHAKERA